MTNIGRAQSTSQPAAHRQSGLRLLWVPGLVLVAVAALLVRHGEAEFAAAQSRGWPTVPAASAPSAETHAAMVADQRGQVWFLTTSGKVLVYTADGRLLRTITTEYSGASLLAVDPGGHPWIASAADPGVNVQADDGQWTTYLVGSTVNGLVVDRQGIGWVEATAGLFKIDPRQPGQKPAAAGPGVANGAHISPRAMAVDGAGHLWVVYDDGYLYETADGAQWTRTPTGLDPSAAIDCLAFDVQGQPWICSRGSLRSLGAAGQWLTRSLPSGLSLRGYAFNSWAMDKAGNVWLGTTGAGVYEYDHAGAWHAFTPENSGLDAPLVQVVAVGQEAVWGDTGNNVYDLGAAQTGAAPGSDPRPGWRAAASAVLLAGALLAVAAVPSALQPGNLALFAIPFVGWLAGDAALGWWVRGFLSGGGKTLAWLIGGVPLLLIIHAAVVAVLARKRNRWLSLGFVSAVGLYALGTLIIAPAGQAGLYALYLYPFYLPLPR